MKGVRTHDLYNLRYQRTRDLWAGNDPENARSIHCGWFRPNDQSSRTAGHLARCTGFACRIYELTILCEDL